MSKIKGTKIRTFNSAGEAFLELNNKGCEAIVNDKPVNEYFLTQKASSNLNLREVPGVLRECREFRVQDDYYRWAI